ncbi:MAG: hypothetical protein H0V34_10065 [Gammaproteobacteria bacterium]|nr:hypothetical protein [Gammaproteobacteria bacterium]
MQTHGRISKAKAVRVSLLGGRARRPATWHLYQRYYLIGLRAIPGLEFSYADTADRRFAWTLERNWPGASRAWEYYAGLQAKQREETANHVARYLFYLPTRAEPVRVAIDQHDGRGIREPEAHDWAEIYFKVNRWPNLDYSDKVRGLVTGNGALTQARIDRLVALRDYPKHLDLVFTARLWPSVPGPTYWHPVEHLVRLFETLAQLNIRSLLRAIVPRSHEGELPKHFIDRLVNCGVQLTKTNITVDELWAATAAARVAFLRPGKHLCVSWRMIDHLAMGACTVCDRAAYTQWPVPMRAGREFVNCEIGIDQDESLPAIADYECISDTVMALVHNADRAASVRDASAAYFDGHVTPKRIARYLIETADRIAQDAGPRNIKPAKTRRMKRPSRR